MKFSEMPYTRPDMDRMKAEVASILSAFAAAGSAEEQAAAFDRYNALLADFSTQKAAAYVRHTVDTRDGFYDKENEFFDENDPVAEELSQQVARALLASKFRSELEARYGALLFRNLEISVRSFKPEMIGLMQQENRLQSEYQKLYASALVDFRGEKLPLPKLSAFKEDPDRQVRREAYETEGRFFDEHREEFDRIYDELVKNRTAQARMLGHENYIQLGYDRLGRNCYGQEQVAAFREQIARDLVPVVSRVKRDQEKRIGVDKLKFYDDPVLFPDGNARPHGSADEILEAGWKMYRGLSPETAEFIDFMYDNGMLDVLSKEGKAPGGYSIEIYGMRACFIFSNFNGTSGDVDVLTHEAGHAFAGFRAMRRGYIPELVSPTIEACECHSMSMEFLTSAYHGLFFGPDTRKYEIGHCESALIFIPYGCMVDEFQHLMYQNPELTPAQRNETWLALEKKYRPWIYFDNLPFYSRGAGWQRQLHIYLYPLYYIDYCMAQTVAFQFWMEFLEDRQAAWEKYLAFVDKGGTETFDALVRGSGLKVPYEPGCIRAIGERVSGWLDANPLT